MSQEVKLAATVRDERGTRAAMRLRAEGKVPGVLYGHREEPRSVAVDDKQLRNVLRDHAHGLLTLDLAGAAESAVIKDVQYDTFGTEILHVDFYRIAKGEKIVVDVAVDLKGTAIGVQQGGVLDFELHSLRIECPAESIVESLAVSIDGLKLGDVIHVRDVKLPAGLVCKNDPEAVVVKVMAPHAAPEAAVAGAPGAAEPELIRREKPAEDDAKDAKDKK